MSYTTSELLRMFADEYDRVGPDWWKNFEILTISEQVNPTFARTLVIAAITNPEIVIPKPKTITVNGVEVPEPIRERPIFKNVVYCCHPLENMVFRWVWNGFLEETNWLSLGYLHYDIKSAKQHVAAINECNVEDVQVG